MCQCQALLIQEEAGKDILIIIAEVKDVNTFGKKVSGDFFKIYTPLASAFGGSSSDAFQLDRTSEFYLNPANNNVYWKVSGGQYYKEAPNKFIHTDLASGWVQVSFDLDAGRSLAVGYDTDLNTKRGTITGDFLKIKAEYMASNGRGSAMLEIDGIRVSEIYMGADGMNF